MAFRILFPSTVALGASLGYYHSSHRRPTLLQTYRCETPSSFFSDLNLPWSLRRKMAPPPKDYSGYNPTTYRQLSTGSFVGLSVGLCVAKFGKTLCLLVGILMLLVESLARQGINVIPAGRIKNWAEEVDVRGLILENTAFKISFGTAFMMASMYG